MAKRVRRTPEEARDEILKAAEVCIREDGPDGMRLVDVAARAGMHHSNVLHHFGSRESLIQAVTAIAIERGVDRAARAFGESLAAPSAQRAEALAKVFDVIQQEGTGRLYAWLILSGLVNEVNPPDLESLVRVATAWRHASSGKPSGDQGKEQLRFFTLFAAIMWLGEAVAGEVLCHALKLPGGEDGLKAFRRWVAANIVKLLEVESAQRSDQKKVARVGSAAGTPTANATSSIQMLNDEGVDPIDWHRVPNEGCPVRGALDLLGDRWSLLIVRDVMNGVRRFDQLARRLNIGRATLSDRLERLVDGGVLEVADYVDTRGRTRGEYRLTHCGWELRNVVIALNDWGTEHVVGTDNQMLSLRQRETGRPVRLAVVDDQTGAEVDASSLVWAPGPAFPSQALSGHGSDRVS